MLGLLRKFLFCILIVVVLNIDSNAQCNEELGNEEVEILKELESIRSNEDLLEYISEILKDNDFKKMSSFLNVLNLTVAHGSASPEDRIRVLNIALSLAACYTTNEQIIDLLIESGAQVNNTDLMDTLPLLCALNNENHMAIKALLKNNADPNETVSIEYNVMGLKEASFSLFFEALLSSESVLNVFLQNSSNIDLNHEVTFSYDNGNTHSIPLMHSLVIIYVMTGGYDEDSILVFNRLLKLGVDINSIDKYGHTPLDYAIGLKAEQAVNYFREFGAKTSEELNEPNAGNQLQQFQKKSVAVSPSSRFLNAIKGVLYNE